MSAMRRYPLRRVSYEFCDDMEKLFGFTFTDEEIVERDPTVRAVSVTYQAADRFIAFMDGKIHEVHGVKERIHAYQHEERGIILERTVITEEEDDESQKPDHD